MKGTIGAAMVVGCLQHGAGVEQKKIAKALDTTVQKNKNTGNTKATKCANTSKALELPRQPREK